MLSNAPSLPAKPIHDLAEAAAPVVEPPLVRRRLERGAQGRDVLRAPDGREDVPCGVEAVLCGGVVVLLGRRGELAGSWVL